MMLAASIARRTGFPVAGSRLRQFYSQLDINPLPERTSPRDEAPRSNYSLDSLLSATLMEQAEAKQALARRQIRKAVSPALQKQAKVAIGDQLLDAESARYRFDFTSTEGNNVAVCGAVNAKNGYGGYGGFQIVLRRDDERPSCQLGHGPSE
jgi:hypothetical protein